MNQQDDGHAAAAECLRLELLHRRDADLSARSAVISGEEGSFARAMAVDDDNSAWMRDVTATWGWPGRSLVGDEAAHAAWLLAQHADRDPALQQHCLELLEQAVAAGEAALADLAFLTDRVLLAKGANQVYGTQTAASNGRYFACRLSDPETVDDRRAEMGLRPLETHLREALELNGPPSPAIIICPNCRSEVEVWLPPLGERSVARCNSCQTTYTIRPSIPRTE